MNQKWVYEFLVKFAKFSFKLGVFFFLVFLQQNVVHFEGVFFFSYAAALLALQFYLHHYFQMRDGKDQVLINLNAERKYCLISDSRSED